MTVDSLTKLPDKNLFLEDLIVGKKQHQSHLKIDLKDQKTIIFPKNGLFITVCLYTEKYYLDNEFSSRPFFGAVSLNKSSKFHEFQYLERFGKYNWEEPFYSVDKIQCFDFGIEIEILNNK